MYINYIVVDKIVCNCIGLFCCFYVIIFFIGGVVLFIFRSWIRWYNFYIVDDIFVVIRIIFVILVWKICFEY